MRYHAGSKAEAMRRMAECAIRDRRAMIDSLRQEPWNSHLEDKAEIENCRKDIQDFRRIARTQEGE